MEELFVENFSRHRQPAGVAVGVLDGNIGKDKIYAENSLNVLDLSVLQDNAQKIAKKNSDVFIDMSICLDRLEKVIEEGYADHANYRFIFNKIRTSFKQNSVEKVIDQLDHLEELLDLGMPALIMKKHLNQKNKQ